MRPKRSNRRLRLKMHTSSTNSSGGSKLYGLNEARRPPSQALRLWLWYSVMGDGKWSAG